VRRKSRQRKPETPFPDDFSVSKTELELAEKLGLVEYRERAAFKDKALAKAWTNVDWRAAYRTWLRKSAEFSAGSGRAPGAIEHQQRQPMPAAQTYFELEPEVPPEERLTAQEIAALSRTALRRMPA